MGAGHDIQVIKIVAVGGADRVVAARHHDDVAILHAQRFIKIALIGVDTLKSKSLVRFESMVVGLLERRFLARKGGVVLVRRIARPVAAGGDHLDDQQAVRWRGLRQNVANVAGIGTRAAYFHAHVGRGDQARRAPRLTGRRANRQFDSVLRRDREARSGGSIDRAGRGFLEYRAAATDSIESLSVYGNIGPAREHHDADLARVLAALYDLPR